jgi:hypothetical protein
MVKTAVLLQQVSTRGSSLSSLDGFAVIKELTVDFDFQDYSSALDDFLFEKGRWLVSLTTSDQPVAIDIAMVAESCPLLQEVTGKFNGVLSNETQLPTLKSARIIIDCVSTVVSLCQFALNLEVLVAKPLTWPYGPEKERMSDVHLAPIITNGSSFQKLQCFVIQEPTDLTVECIRSFYQNSPVLRLLGQLRNFNLRPKEGNSNENLARLWESLKNEVSENNLDLTLVPCCDDAITVNLLKYITP